MGTLAALIGIGSTIVGGGIATLLYIAEIRGSQLVIESEIKGLQKSYAHLEQLVDALREPIRRTQP